MKILNNKKNQIAYPLNLNEMIGRYKANIPINCVDLKKKIK